MLRRRVRPTLLKKLKQFPAVALLGARQVGKTTLAKSLGPFYYDCEQPEERLRIDIEWEKIVSASRLVIFDEAQTFPELFARLRGAIDQDRKRNNRFLILGSIAPGIMKEVSESLTGRLGLCELTPFLVTEVAPEKSDDLWLKGGYPGGGILRPRSYPEWQRDYLALLAQRDLPHWGLSAKPRVTERLFQMLAALHGCPWNASQLGKSLGLSYHTVNSYLDYLESAFLIRRLPPFHHNIKKRIVKSPKVYWRDTGLLHALLGVDNISGLMTQPWVGLSWEGWVIEQIIGHLNTLGRSFQESFLRTQDQEEIDLILEYQGRRWAFEIKLSSHPDADDLKRLNRLADQIGAHQRILVSRTGKTVKGGNTLSTNIHDLFDILK